jgi:hypothetical protein
MLQEGGMKKFFAVFLVLLIVGALGFFFGWAQLPVPAGTYGVMRSKTHGLDPNLIREGEVRWVWYKLIPSNVTIEVYSLNRIDRTISFRGRLPSGDAINTTGADDAIGAFPGFGTDFAYKISANISFKIKADSLISLIAEKNLAGQEDLELYEESLAAQIEAFILEYLETAQGVSITTQGDAGEFKAILGSGLSPRLEDKITEAFPQIGNLSCRVPPSVFPDFILYQQALGAYENFLAKEREYSNGGTGAGADAAKRLNSRFRLDELARYGELLTKYPILLQYLALESGATLEAPREAPLDVPR